MSDYWIEVVSSSLGDHGVSATPEQIEAIARDMEGSSENRYMGGPDTPNPAIAEAKEAQAKYIRERDKVHCRECNGRGRIYSQGPHHGYDTECWKCRGHGRHDP